MVRKSRYKPFYKQFIRLRRNVQNRPKLFKFKRQKWKKFQQYSKNQLKFYRRFKIKDQFQLSVSRFASRGNSFQKKFRENLYERKAFSLFYGKLKKRYLKKHIIRSFTARGFLDFRSSILKVFESRLDITLYRANFTLSVESARQLILHGHVFVNGSIVKTKSYILKENDLIEVSYSPKVRALVKKNLDRSNFWPIPPKHLVINYRTLQILFIYSDASNLMPVLNYYLNLNSIAANIKKL